MSGSAYLDAIAGAYPPAYAGPAGGGAVTAGTVYSYDDVRALISQARSLAVSQLVSGPGPYDVSYVSHVMTALKAARDAVLRASSQGAAGYNQSELSADFANVGNIVSSVWADQMAGYDRAVGDAVLYRQAVVALPIAGQDAVDAAAFAGVQLNGDFKSSVTAFLDALNDAVSVFQGYESYAHLMGETGLLGFIGDAAKLVVDALSGLWGFAKGVGAALAGLGSLAPLVVYGAVAAGGYVVAKKVGLIGKAKAA